MIIKSTTQAITRQILFNPVLHQSVGCVIPQTVGVTADGRLVALAGTPLKIDLDDRTAGAEKADATVAMNAVLVHDVDVTHGDGNGTACIFGFINKARVDVAVVPAIETATTNADATKLITFLTQE
jgi:hypothetical protein